MRDDELHTLGVQKQGGALVYRVNGETELKVPGGIACGGFGTSGYGPTGALYEDSGQVCFAYYTRIGTAVNAVVVNGGIPAQQALLPNHTVLDIKQICGFDYFYGFNCQMLAHSYYPDYLWENDRKVLTGNEYMPVSRRLDPGADPYDIRSYDKFNQKAYSCDLMYGKLEQWVSESAASGDPFLLMWTTTVPHSTVQAPEEEVMYYVRKLGEEKTPITDGGWYYPVLYPHSAYAAMITHIDTQVGRLVARLKELGVYDNTLIIITSDNGPACNSNSPIEYFRSGGPFRCGKGWGKRSLQEGGIRMPFVACWGDRLKPGRCGYIGQFTDLMPTFAELAGAEAPECDGISFVPALYGKKQPEREFLYWEFPGGKGLVAVRMGKWKGIVRDVKNGSTEMELYDLESDPGETENLAAAHPETVARMWEVVEASHAPVPSGNPNFEMTINYPQ